MKYSLSDVRKGINDPLLFIREINRLYHSSFHSKDYNNRGIDIVEEDWDTLLILDACRYDSFSKYAPQFELPGKIESRISRGSSTSEFIRGNFHDRDLLDTVYVSATTMLYRESCLNKRVNINMYDIVDVWDDSIDHGEFGIEPQTMYKKALQIHEKYPNKKIIIHFIQPHIPFLGATGKQHFNENSGDIWNRKRKSNIGVSKETIMQAYHENLALALPFIKELLGEIKGKTVVTSDHGQMIGERATPVPIREYGHPSKLYTKELVKVPWHVCINGERRDIQSGESGYSYDKQSDDLDNKAKKHLEALGYI